MQLKFAKQETFGTNTDGCDATEPEIRLCGTAADQLVRVDADLSWSGPLCGNCMCEGLFGKICGTAAGEALISVLQNRSFFAAFSRFGKNGNITLQGGVRLHDPFVHCGIKKQAVGFDRKGVNLMRKKKIELLFSLLYYALVPVIFLLFFGLASLFLKRSGGVSNIGATLLVTYGVFFVGLWLLTAVLMRFSLLKWYFDPFAAAEAPLLLYACMLLGSLRQSGKWTAAFLLTNRSLCDDGGAGWLFLAVLFAFGLVMSFSVARKNGTSISFRLVSKSVREKAPSDAEIKLQAGD